MLKALKHTLFAVGLASSLGPVVAQENKLTPVAISEELTIDRQTIDVLDSTMSYLEKGTGEPILFIHGNPTSSYLWRNVMPYVADTNRAIAVDLIGMGASGKPDIEHLYGDHYAYLEAFVKKLDLENITLVIHDWGATLGWDLARRNPDRVKRIAFMEGVLPPAFPIPSFDAMGDVGQALKAMRDPVKGPEMVLKGNMFVENVLPGFVNRTLGDVALDAYRAPFTTEKDRIPTLSWPRHLPIEGDPAEMVKLMGDLQAFMTSTDLPTLLIYAEPGVLVPPEATAWYTANMKNIETSYAGQGFHFFQEDQPDAIGRALEDWIRRN